MTGNYLAELLAGCLGLGTTLNTALTTAGLTPFVKVTDPTGIETWANNRPCLLVDLPQLEELNVVGTGNTPLVVERRRVAFEAYVDGSNADASMLGKALSYEGVMLQVLNDQFDTIRAAVTEHNAAGVSPVTQWRLTESRIELDRERVNVPLAFVIRVEVSCWMEWP